jgi:hypothetical protein
VFILKIKKNILINLQKKKETSKLLLFFYPPQNPEEYKLPITDTKKKNKNIDHRAICACNSTKGSTIYSA